MLVLGGWLVVFLMYREEVRKTSSFWTWVGFSVIGTLIWSLLFYASGDTGGFDGLVTRELRYGDESTLAAVGILALVAFYGAQFFLFVHAIGELRAVRSAAPVAQAEKAIAAAVNETPATNSVLPSNDAGRAWAIVSGSLDAQDYSEYMSRYEGQPEAILAARHLRQLAKWEQIDKSNSLELDAFRAEGLFGQLETLVKAKSDELRRQLEAEKAKAEAATLAEEASRKAALAEWRANAVRQAVAADRAQARVLSGPGDATDGAKRQPILPWVVGIYAGIVSLLLFMAVFSHGGTGGEPSQPSIAKVANSYAAEPQWLTAQANAQAAKIAAAKAGLMADQAYSATVGGQIDGRSIEYEAAESAGAKGVRSGELARVRSEGVGIYAEAFPTYSMYGKYAGFEGGRAVYSGVYAYLDLVYRGEFRYSEGNTGFVGVIQNHWGDLIYLSRNPERIDVPISAVGSIDYGDGRKYYGGIYLDPTRDSRPLRNGVGYELVSGQWVKKFYDKGAERSGPQ